MSMYGNILDKLDDSLFIKIEPGKPITLRLLDHPWISQKQFTDKTTGEMRIVTQFHWPVWDYSQQRVRVLSQGKSVFKQIASSTDTWPQGEDMPSPFDIYIKRTGTGQYDTEYTVSAVPQQGTMPAIAKADLPNMAEKSKGIPIQQILEGKKPQVLTASVAQAKQSEPEESIGMRPLAGLNQPDEREPEEGDTIITDLDTANQINLDDIPF